MEALMQGWLSIWLYVMAAIGIVLGFLSGKTERHGLRSIFFARLHYCIDSARH